MKKILVFGAAIAMLVSSAAHAQTIPPGTLATMTPAQLDIVRQVMNHYIIKVRRSDGSSNPLNGSEIEALERYKAFCKYGVVMAIANGSLNSAGAVAAEETRCFQWWIDKDGLQMQASWIYH